MFNLKDLDINHFLELLIVGVGVGVGGFGLISPLYSTIVPRIFGIPK